jgi:hypothetical protein
LADAMMSAWDSAGEGGIVEIMFGVQGLLASAWQPDADAREFLSRALAG